MARLARDSSGFRVVGATEKVGSSAIGLDVGLAAKLGAMEVTTKASLAEALAPRGRRRRGLHLGPR